MNSAIHIPTTGSPSAAGIWQRMLKQVAVKLIVAFLLAPGLIGSARAVEQPPETASQQRAWLTSHLVTDMQSVGSFTSNDIAQMVTLINTLTDDQASLLTRFYYLTREKTEQDAQLYTAEQTDTSEALAQAKAQVADLLTQLQNQIQQTYSELATINPGCETLCQIAYASVPGWCAYNQYAIPDWYYNNGCYVGPVFSANYCGAYAAPVYRTFYNRGSHYNWWNSRTYIHNNIVRIGHHRSPVVVGNRYPHPVNHTGAATVNHNAPPVLKHNNPNPRANHAPNAVARHNATHNPAAVGKNHAHVSGAKNANHSQPHAVAHNNPKPAAHPKAHAQAHAAPRPHQRHVAHAQPHAQHAAHPQPQHVAQAHSSSGHGHHK
jgi:hypothetical protein